LAVRQNPTAMLESDFVDLEFGLKLLPCMPPIKPLASGLFKEQLS